MEVAGLKAVKMAIAGGGRWDDEADRQLYLAELASLNQASNDLAGRMIELKNHSALLLLSNRKRN
jgi:hypothetical protein